MRTCCICRFETELDDLVIARGADGCICLRCFLRETGDGRQMPKDLRRDLIAALAGIDAEAASGTSRGPMWG